MHYFYRHLVAALSLFTSAFLTAQSGPDILWQRCYGGSSDDVSSVIEPTSDGGYVIVGTSRSQNGDVTLNQGLTDIWVIKLSATGGILWQRTLGGSGFETIGGVKETVDGGYIVAGSSESSNGDLTDNYGLYDAWLVKLNALGAVEWQKNFGGSDLDSFRDIQILADGSFIVLGNTSSTDGDVTGMNGISDVWLVNVDATGTLLWQATYGGSEEDLAGRMVLTTDDHLVVCGVSRSNDGDVSNNHGAEDVWVFKVDLEGTMIWERSFGGSGEDRGIRVVEVTDQQFVICGYTLSSDEDVSFNNGFIDAWVFKLNNAGELLWEHALGGLIWISCSPVSNYRTKIC